MIAVARLVPVKSSIIKDSDKLASLRANKDPRYQNDSGFLDYFYLSPAVSGGGEWVVDFSQIASFPGTEYQYLLRRKLLQLSDRERVKFKIKLAVYLGRLTDEEQFVISQFPSLMAQFTDHTSWLKQATFWSPPVCRALSFGARLA